MFAERGLAASAAAGGYGSKRPALVRPAALPSACVRSLSVVFPCYNDAPTIGALVERAFRILEERIPDHEVIVVNDGSRDSSAEVLRALERKYPGRLKTVHHTRNRGYGGALRSGFRRCSKEWVFYTDGDGQYDVADLPRLLALAAPDIGLVNGYKARRRDGWHRILAGVCYGGLSRRLFGLPVRDPDCDFRLIRADLLRGLELRSNSGPICVELVKGVARSGNAIRETAVTHLPRLHGRSQFFRPKHLWTTLVEFGQVYYRLMIRGEGKVH